MDAKREMRRGQVTLPVDGRPCVAVVTLCMPAGLPPALVGGGTCTSRSIGIGRLACAVNTPWLLILVQHCPQGPIAHRRLGTRFHRLPDREAGPRALSLQEPCRSGEEVLRCRLCLGPVEPPLEHRTRCHFFLRHLFGGHPSPAVNF